MRQSYTNDIEFDKEMNKLVKNGNICFYEEGSLEGKRLSMNLTENGELSLVSKGMRLSEERSGFFENLWKSIKSIFSAQARINHITEKFFDNYQNDRQQEILSEQVEMQKREKLHMAAKKEIQSGLSFEKHLDVENIFDKNVKEIFGEKTSLQTLEQNGYVFDMPIISDINVNNLDEKYSFCAPDKLPYISLCLGAGYSKSTGLVKDNFIQTAFIQKCLSGQYSLEANNTIESFVEDTKEITNNCMKDLSANKIDTLANGLINGISSMNRMLATSLPNEFLDPKSNCFLTGKCIKEILSIIDQSPELKSAVKLSEHDKIMAEGACEIWNIFEKSSKAQKELSTKDSCDIEKQAEFIEHEIKMRAELFNGAYLSDWSSEFNKVKKTIKNLDEMPLLKNATITDIVCNSSEKYPNLAIREIGQNPNLFNSEIKTSIKDKFIDMKPQEITANILNLIKQETQVYLQNKVKEMQAHKKESHKLHKEKIVGAEKSKQAEIKIN